MQVQWGTLKEKIPLVIAISFIVGLIIGLVVLGWWLWPVEYTDTDIHALRERHRATYVELVADSYALTGNLTEAQNRLQMLVTDDRSMEDVGDFVLNQAQVESEQGDAESSARLRALAMAMGVEPTPPVAAETPVVEEEPEPEEGGGIWRTLGRICLGALLVLLVLGGAFLIFSYLRGRRSGGRLPRRVMPSEDIAERPEEEEETEVEDWAPENIAWDTEAGPAPGLSLGHFVTTFELGDDGYDESFGIETETGEFLGECGVAISEVIGTGTEKPVAFDFWLFDKTDIRTVTTVVSSEYAFEDESLRTKLAAKGDVVLAQEGLVIELETATLQVDAEIVDVVYGDDGDLPGRSYFERFMVELSPSTKEEA
jgi:hypothetical protein